MCMYLTHASACMHVLYMHAYACVGHFDLACVAHYGLGSFAVERLVISTVVVTF